MIETQQPAPEKHLYQVYLEPVPPAVTRAVNISGGAVSSADPTKPLRVDVRASRLLVDADSYLTLLSVDEETAFTSAPAGWVEAGRVDVLRAEPGPGVLTVRNRYGQTHYVAGRVLPHDPDRGVQIVDEHGVVVWTFAPGTWAYIARSTALD